MLELSAEDRAAMRKRGKTDPVWWVEKVLGDHPWPKQCEVLRSVRDNKESAVRSCHGIGKSWIAARVALWFLFHHEPSIVITTAPTDRQVRAILWKEIRAAHRKAKIPLGGEMLSQELKLSDEWFAWGFTAPERDPDRFQGFHAEHILAIVDEASGVSSQIFDEGVSAVLSSAGSRLLLIGNPTNPGGEFAKAFKDPHVRKISVSAFDSPNFTGFGITQEDIELGTWEKKITGPLPRPQLVEPEWVAKRWERWGRSRNSPNYMARVLGQFPEISEDTLIQLHWIEAAQQRQITPKDSDVHILGVDVARFGSDESVAYQRHGGRFRLVFAGRGFDTRETTGRVIHERKNLCATRSNVDVIGLGAGVVDGLHEVNEPVAAINVAEASSDPEQFANLRAELYWLAREMFEKGEVDLDPVDEELAAQLSEIRYKYDGKGRIHIESKEEMKRRGLASPDRADAFVLSLAPDRAGEDRDAKLKKIRALGKWR